MILWSALLGTCETQMMNAGDVEAAVLLALEVAQSTYGRWRKQDGAIES